MVKLVVCEKPSVAASVASALPGIFSKTSWGYQSASYWVCSASGHLLELLAPEDYDPKYKTWILSDLPIVPQEFRYRPSGSRASDILRSIKTLANDPQVTSIVNACDAGREGEGIFALIYQWLGSSKPVERAWFNSMTTSAISSSFTALKPSDSYAGLKAAAASRAQADWLVGMNATRAASCTLAGSKFLLSIGRVQTPTLSLIVSRDIEIDGFVSQPYQVLKASFTLKNPDREFVASWRPEPKPSADEKIFDPVFSQELLKAVRAAGKGVVEYVKVAPVTSSPPKLYDLTALQRQANKSFGFSAQRTLDLAQALYEEYKVLTYPRTDSRYITQDMVATLPGIMSKIATISKEYAAVVKEVVTRSDFSAIVNDKEVTDHHAIIPTDNIPPHSSLPPDELKLYLLVVRRFLEAVLGDLVQEKTMLWVRVPTTLKDQWFFAQGRRDLVLGYKSVFLVLGDTSKEADKDKDKDADEQDEGTICAVQAKEPTDIKSASLLDKKTKPKEYHNDGSILSLMESAGKMVDDKEVSLAMKDKGLGTPATRASIIETLVTREYVSRKGKILQATDKGRCLIVSMGQHPLTSPEMTGEWELRLKEMERSEAATVDSLRKDFYRDVTLFTKQCISDFADKTPDMFKSGRKTYGACPMKECEGMVVFGKSGWGCSTYKSKDDTGCGFVFWQTQGTKQMKVPDLLEYMSKVKAGLVSPVIHAAILGPCPRCGQDVKEYTKGWSCSSYKSKTAQGCGYALWKTSKDGTELTLEKAKELLDAKFDTGPAAILGPCPRCGQDVKEHAKGWGCSSYKSKTVQGCGYALWRTSKDGTELTLEKAKELLDAKFDSSSQGSKVFAPCPVCKGTLLEREKVYSCNSYKSPKSKGCGLAVWKVDKGKQKSQEEIKIELARKAEEITAKRNERKIKKKSSS